MTKSDDELRHLILARRARFVAAAMGTSGVVLVSCSEPTVCLSPPVSYSTETWSSSQGTPSVCLSPLESYSTETTTTGSYPSVCLEPPWTSGTSPDAGADAGADAGSPPTGTHGGTVDTDAGLTTTTAEPSASSSTTSSPTSELTSLIDVDAALPTPCLSPPFHTDAGLDSLDASTSELTGSPSDASESH